MRYHNPYHRYGHRYRRNGDIASMIALMESMGMVDLASEIRFFSSDPDIAPLLSQIADEVANIMAEPEPVVEPARMTDAQAWYALADLVPSALSSLSTEYQSALINAFREEAAKAA